MADADPMIQYECDNPGCGVLRASRTNLAVYGTCKECGTGVMRRKGRILALLDKEGGGDGK